MGLSDVIIIIITHYGDGPLHLLVVVRVLLMLEGERFLALIAGVHHHLHLQR